jgi:hypothetical protein
MSDVNARIRAYCDAHGLRFREAEIPRPWEIDPSRRCPFKAGTASAIWWSKCLLIRAGIIAGLESEKPKKRVKR